MIKNILFVAISFLLATNTYAQVSFSEDFESYNVGDYLGEVSSDWTTWNGMTGGAGDMRIVDDYAASGTRAGYIANFTGTNLTPDIVLPFGGTYTEGQFDFSLKILIEDEFGGAYFNVQGTEELGEIWATQVHFYPNGSIYVSQQNTQEATLTGTYEKNTWVEISYSIDLDANNWEVFVDGSSIGSFQANFNTVSALNLSAPSPGQEYWLDDVSFSYDSEGGGSGGGGGTGSACSDATYCVPPSLDSSNEWIEVFMLNTLSNFTVSDNGYGDYTGGASTDLATNNSYDINIIPNFPGNIYEQNIKVWIDFNQDGDFEDVNEEVFSATNVTTNAPGTGSIDIPANAPLGATRMRVVMQTVNAPIAPSPCTTPTQEAFGEVEDYCVTIVEGTSTATNDFATEVESLSVFPNPFNEQFTVDFVMKSPQQVVMLDLMDSTGRVLQSQKMHNVRAGQQSVSFETPKTVAGVYWLRLATPNWEYALKKIVAGAAK